MPVIMGLVVPGLPHPLLAPDQDPAWGHLRAAYDAAAQRVRRAVEEEGADLLVLFSTQWTSIIGHQVQADPHAEWVHVDPEFHALGSIPYQLRIDAPFAESYVRAAHARGLAARTVAYKGFPIDTGSVVALKLLDPEGRLAATTTSCNIYSDRAETLVLGKAAHDAIEAGGRRAIAVAVTALSNRMHTRPVSPDRISSPHDEEWNQKLVELLAEGRLEDVSQLARTVSDQAHADSKMKAFWWLGALMGQHNAYAGEVLGYGPLFGTGAVVASLRPSDRPSADHEFDEEDVETYGGDREVLDAGVGEATPVVAPPPAPPIRREGGIEVSAAKAPSPVGAYPHARKVGDLLFLSGCGPRQPGTNEIPGGPVRDANGAPLDYDIRAQTRATIENIRAILEASGSSLEAVVDVTSFLVDMDRDFAGYNEVYASFFKEIGPTRTTLAIDALPTPIAVELKVVAYLGAR